MGLAHFKPDLKYKAFTESKMCRLRSSFNKGLCWGILIMTIGWAYSCHSYQHRDSEDCQKLYGLYVNHIMESRYDSASFYLTQALDCDTNNLQFALELYRVKLLMGNYAEALEVLRNMNRINPHLEFSITEELLLFEINGQLNYEQLREYYHVYQSRVFEDSALEKEVFYLVALEYFFKGRTEALKVLDSDKAKLLEPSPVLSTARELVLTEDSLYVMKEVFNVQ